MFYVVVCSRMSLINRNFWPIYLPFMNPVWYGLMRGFNTLCNLLAITFDAVFVVQVWKSNRPPICQAKQI